ncbi:MAG TPA: BlaI/MecI/CopY family transcriptional regulator [archaeon]|nr:BlaI/MecI/CopY family transcriptional regulator [archaeon]
MTDHDLSSYDSQKLLNDLNAVKRISPEFNTLSEDMQDIMKESSNPAFLAALLYKLTKEREETNLILKRLEEKFAKIQELLKNQSNTSSNPNTEDNILSEPDQHIMQLITTVGMVSAQDVQSRLSYKNSNAASQRLNNLVRRGHLKRIRSGKKVMFMPQHPNKA